MLRAIELSGFKSFADKTRFEFPKGITVIVGPNGSGKSNVVDAIKWVLGEQSPKSLRGKEMADVIFNGSGSRRPLNAADVTLTLDNAESLLSVDTPEVKITRRVYRSGESEYLINRQPSRLRDIRDLFAGTGVATEAYSVIEQGKVDVLLQSSPKDRRLIFEEAAGISRFKAKKVEATRRLERVDQNLLRLGDIVEEVESRLRSVRMQASKARRYREYSTRLRELRTDLALVDWRRHSEALAAIDAESAALAQDGDACRSEMQRLEAESLGVETEIVELDEAIRAGEARMAEVRERIAAAESLVEGQRSRGREFDEQSARLRRQQSALAARSGDANGQIAEVRKSVDAIVLEAEQLRKKLANDDSTMLRLASDVDRLRSVSESSRVAYAERMREAAAIDQEMSALEAQRMAASEAVDRAAERIEALSAQAFLATAELEEVREQHDRSSSDGERISAALETSQLELSRRRQEYAEVQASLADLRIRKTAAQERSKLLAELEEKLEGLSAGVKQALSESRTRGDSIFRSVRGLVADVIDVNVDMAPLVDVALGEMAGHLVVGDDRNLFDALAEGRASLAGRVALVRSDIKRPPTWTRPADLSGQAGVVGRADEFVRTADEFAALVERLLGHTWIVESLHVAMALAQNAGQARFVTLAGELVTADGLVLVGPRLATTGLISRRSELRSLRVQLASLASEIESGQRLSDTLSNKVADGETESKTLAAELRKSQQINAEHRARRQAAEQRGTQLAEQVASAATERDAAEERRSTATARLSELEAKRAMLATTIAAAEAEIADERAREGKLEADRIAMLGQTSAARVELAKSEQQLEHQREQLRQFEMHRAERDRAAAEYRDQLAECATKQLESQRAILRTTSEAAVLYLDKEAIGLEVRGRVDAREGRRAARNDFTARIQKLRARVRVVDDKRHELDLAGGEVRHERAVLADRLREDYELDLAELALRPHTFKIAAPHESENSTHGDRTPEQTNRENDVAEPPFDRAAVENEIAELRRKVNTIGGVNVDALAELDELETRHAALAAQHNDLVTAKASLEQIIEKINADSRRLFADTLETVRGHFQQLFRKLFGGGQADVVLEQGVDVLDAGIEIVARPPGKEPRSISLLSGGEKTLTCVALLLAVFRNRPSPFCVLDEVDAALDEANIERFVSVLREFLTITQFIVVTHSKKTMTAASTLYGVTMQESGVSKRVSVRFEDVSETGEISQAAVSRSASEPVDDSEESDPPAADAVINAGGEAVGDVEENDETQAA